MCYYHVIVLKKINRSFAYLKSTHMLRLAIINCEQIINMTVCDYI